MNIYKKLSLKIFSGFLFLNTIRFLTTRQIFFRIYKAFTKFYRPPNLTQLKSLPINSEKFNSPYGKRFDLEPDGRYFFGGNSFYVSDFSDLKKYSLLTQFHFNYFDWLLASGSKQKETDQKVNSVLAWLDYNQSSKNLNPYVTSLRIYNWVIFFSTHNDLLDRNILNSLGHQVIWLSKNIEYHLGGNHLLSNFKGLIFGSAFLHSETALMQNIFESSVQKFISELKKQILSDGGHYERSPMYHSLIIKDVIDVILLLESSTPRAVSSKSCHSWLLDLTNTVDRMLIWLVNMDDGSGTLPRFNDTTDGVAPDLSWLLDQRNGLTEPFKTPMRTDNLVILEASGFVVARLGESTLIFDVGSVGPKELPGHSHSEALSFELVHKKTKLICNNGIDRYGQSFKRIYQRSSRNHSTFVPDGLNSSQTWSGFRVAQRAKVELIQASETNDQIMIVAKTKGFRFFGRKMSHVRKLVLHHNKLEIFDLWEGPVARGVVNFYSGPKIQFKKDRNRYLLGKREQNVVEINCDVGRIRSSCWYDSFGRSRKNNCLRLVTSTKNFCSVTVNF